MKLLNKILFSLIILSSLVITGCATNQERDYLTTNNIVIERVDSKRVRIGMINVIEAKNGIELRGEIRRHSNSRDPISGHMDIELIGDDGQAVSKLYTRYSRRTHKARTTKFTVKLDNAPEENYVISVAHHYPTSSRYICCHSATDLDK